VPDDRITRVHYFDRQFLQAQDFTNEQAYQIAMRRRHNISNHIWGIVRGLELEFNQQDGVFIVKPGAAVDGYGRELILTEQQQIAVAVFDVHAFERLDIWLEYRLEAADYSKTGSACKPEDSTSDAFYRWLEQPVIVPRKETINESDHRAPGPVLIGDLKFDATRTPPDSPEVYFPVFLGQIRRDVANKQPYSVILTGRPYAGLVGGEIRHPAGDARIIMGEVADNGTRHFKIFVGEDACNPKAKPALDIQSQPNDQPYIITLNGNTTITRDVNVYGAVAFQPSDDPVQQTGGQPGTVSLRKGSMNSDKSKNPNTRELNIELGNGGDEPTRFSVGVWSTENPAGFKPIFTVDANGDVTINGKLIAASVQPLPKQIPALTNEVISVIRQRQLAARSIDARAGSVIGDILRELFTTQSGGGGNKG